MNKDEFFEEIYCSYYEKIYKYIYYKVYDVELAEDLANDVFVAVYKNLHRYDETKSFILTWLYAISSNRLKNYYKSRKTIEYSIECIIETDLESCVMNNCLFEQQEWHLVLQKMIWDLPERNRKVILMKYYGNMTSEEIGKSLDISPGNVRIILKRTLNTLKNKLNAELSC
jgi:RNA polymerase sigma-70 factor (ECF subfamily)